MRWLGSWVREEGRRWKLARRVDSRPFRSRGLERERIVGQLLFEEECKGEESKP